MPEKISLTNDTKFFISFGCCRYNEIWIFNANNQISRIGSEFNEFVLPASGSN